MKRSQLTIALSMLAVFLSGSLVGVFGHRLYTASSVSADRPPRHRPTPEEWRKREVSELSQRLNLQQAQLTTLNQILDTTRDQFRDMREKMRPEGERIKLEQRTRIRAMLTAPQQEQYEQLLQEQEQRRRKQRH